MRNIGDFDRKVLIAETAKHLTLEAESHLRTACEKYKSVLFVTHVPSFPKATWHEGSSSSADWLPWMCNVTMGDMLIEVAYEYPNTSLLVLCGHTHSPGEVQMAPNLRVLTGKSEYGSPQISKILDLSAEVPPIR